MKTDKLIAGEKREICPHCNSNLTAAVTYTEYNPAPNVSACGSVREYVCANCGIKFISTADRDRLKENLLKIMEREAKYASEEH